MNITWAAGSIIGSLTGAIAVPTFTVRGIAQLTRSHAAHRGLQLASAVAGCAAGAAAFAASHNAGTWWIAPALLLWACALVAAAACDAATQRVPTSLVRQAGVATIVLLVLGLSAHGDWRGLVTSTAAAVAAGLALLMCWRFAGAGFGDVRLAVLGGLGLGHATVRGLLLAVLAASLIILVQAGITLARGGDRHSRLPLGPALATGFLLAAAL